MSDHGTHHHEGAQPVEIKSKTAFVSSFWFVIILVGLFIAALNFINVMGDSGESHGGGHEAAAGGATHSEAAGNEHHVADTTHTLGNVSGPAALRDTDVYHEPAHQ